VVAPIDQALAKAEQLMDLPGVVGVGEGATSTGDQAIMVMVSSREVAAMDDIPSEIDGVPVEILETGNISTQDS
jgi:hypothetical protein